MKISGKEYYGVMNPSFKFLGPIVDNILEFEQLERDGRATLQTGCTRIDNQEPSYGKRKLPDSVKL